MAKTSTDARLNSPRIWGAVLAAGRGTRLAGMTGGRAKQFLPFRGLPLYWHSIEKFAANDAIEGLVLALPKDAIDTESPVIRKLCQDRGIVKPLLLSAGGELRQDSVRLALERVPDGVSHVLIHDSARPFFSPALVTRVITALTSGCEGVIPVIPVTDTIKVVTEGVVTKTLDRSALAAVQTPQGFNLPLLRLAHSHALSRHLTATDDAFLLESDGCSVYTVLGEEKNVKITNPEDLSLLEKPAASAHFVVGMGYDVHRYGDGRPMVLGGVPITDAGLQVVAHSDGDVLLHALMDALLGCAALGDIGLLFPDSDVAFEGASSVRLLETVLALVRQKGIEPVHADLTIIAQRPKISPWRERIRLNIARLLSLTDGDVNIKATTEEGLGFTGRIEGIKASAVVTCLRRESSTVDRDDHHD